MLWALCYALTHVQKLSWTVLDRNSRTEPFTDEHANECIDDVLVTMYENITNE